jgi:hypothetical protein
VQQDIMSSNGFRQTAPLLVKENDTSLPPINLDRGATSREMLWQSKVLSTKQFSSTFNPPADVLRTEVRTLTDSHLERRMIEVSDRAQGIRTVRGHRRSYSPGRAPRGKVNFMHATIPPAEPAVASARARQGFASTPRSTQQMSSTFSSKNATGERFQFSSANVSPTQTASDLGSLQHRSPIACAAENFLRSPRDMFQEADPEAELAKDASGRSLAHVSTMASLGDMGVTSVADVWKECLSEMRSHPSVGESGYSNAQAPPGHLTPRPPEAQRSPQMPRGLRSMREHCGPHRKAAPAHTEAPLGGTPRHAVKGRFVDQAQSQEKLNKSLRVVIPFQS